MKTLTKTKARILLKDYFYFSNEKYLIENCESMKKDTYESKVTRINYLTAKCNQIRNLLKETNINLL